MTNRQVIEAWVRGDLANNPNLWTNGKTLWSYNIRIGYTSSLEGSKVVIDYNRNQLEGLTWTTRNHIKQAMGYAPSRPATPSEVQRACQQLAG